MSYLTITYTSIYTNSGPWRFQWVSNDEPKPLPADASPTVLSPSYVTDFDPLEEDPKEDPEEDPAEYPADEGDDDDDEDEKEESFEDEDEEDEHLASTDSTTLPAVDPIPSPLLPLPSPPTHTSHTYAEAPLGYKATMIWSRATSLSTHHLSNIPSPPLLLSSTTHRYDLPKADILLWKRACFTAPTGRFEVEESSSAAATRQTGHTLAHRKMAPNKRTTTTNTTTPMTDAVIKALIAQGVVDALSEYEAHKSSGNSDDSPKSRSGRRTERAARECTYNDFLKCQPLNFKGTEGVFSLTLCKDEVNFCSDLKRKEAYTAYFNPRGLIYQNKDKQNKLMQIDELYKFSDGTLNDVRTALDDRLKGIRIKYLPRAI
nr:hypothetical protein [Tanacetum cinerariifolium]